MPLPKWKWPSMFFPTGILNRYCFLGTFIAQSMLLSNYPSLHAQKVTSSCVFTCKYNPKPRALLTAMAAKETDSCSKCMLQRMNGQLSHKAAYDSIWVSWINVGLNQFDLPFYCRGPLLPPLSPMHTITHRKGNAEMFFFSPWQKDLYKRWRKMQIPSKGMKSKTHS